jgi:hypothetical protein
MYKIKGKINPESITRIEIKTVGKCKLIQLEPTDTKRLCNFLKTKLSEVVHQGSIEFSITESPAKAVDKCRVHVYDTQTKTKHKTKENFKSFTIYGVTADEAHEFIVDAIKG